MTTTTAGDEWSVAGPPTTATCSDVVFVATVLTTATWMTTTTADDALNIAGPPTTDDDAGNVAVHPTTCDNDDVWMKVWPTRGV